MAHETVISVHTDGASRSNPGPASCAYHIEQDGKPLMSYSDYLGPAVTNNVAEYHGMERALRYLVSFTAVVDCGRTCKIEIYSDSQLIVGQVEGKWKVNDATLKALCAECRNHVRQLRDRGHTVIMRWLRREENWLADQLCNRELDNTLSQLTALNPKTT